MSCFAIGELNRVAQWPAIIIERLQAVKSRRLIIRWQFGRQILIAQKPMNSRLGLPMNIMVAVTAYKECMKHCPERDQEGTILRGNWCYEA